MGFSGKLFDPLTGRTRAVEALWGAGSALEIPAEARRVEAAELSVARGGWNGEALVLSWSEDGKAWALTVEDGAAVAELVERAPSAVRGQVEAARREVGRGRRRSRIGLTVLGLILLLPVAALVALFLLRQPIVDAVVRRLPVSVDLQIGEMVHRDLVAGGTLLGDGPARDAVRQLGERLAAAAPGEGFNWRFEVARDPTVNAFAAPGGVVVVHTGLLARAASPEELAGVLAHELTHVRERHSLRQMVFQAGLWASLSLVTGSSEGAAALLAGAARQLSGLQFSRQQETSADLGGLDLLRDARLPAEGLERFFVILRDEARNAGGVLPGFLSSHPASDERLAALKTELGRRGNWPTEPIAIDWAAVQRQAREPE